MSAQVIQAEQVQEPPLNILGLVVRCVPDQIGPVRQSICALRGAEIHAEDPAGKLVVTLEQLPGEPPIKAIDQIERISGVVSTSLVYHFCDA
ncbi:MAG: hypothetical protein D6758_13225 [Gammaproteobacteria bacterium]|nr:MAG: hypothetical protein D6758_13225 [Gammaproteobacteria bacterium]